MSSTRIIATLLISFTLITTAFASRRTAKMNDSEIRKLLIELKDVKDDRETLAALFKTGDEQITGLVKALDDPDQNVSLNAQIVIRYLGNETGLTALEDWYSKQTELRLTAPIPLPLKQRDYAWISEQYLKKPIAEWVFAESYIYALALDGSPRAKDALQKLKTATGEIDGSMVAARTLKLVSTGVIDKTLRGQADLAKLVLENAFFVNADDRRFTSSRLLGLNGSKQKALIEVYINRGPLAEEWYHVVITRSGKGWKFFSITQVAVS